MALSILGWCNRGLPQTTFLRPGAAFAGLASRSSAFGPRARLRGTPATRRHFFGFRFPWDAQDAAESQHALQDLPTDLANSLETRFLSYASGDSSDPRIQLEDFRSLLECTDNFCLTKHWLPDPYVKSLFSHYSSEDGIGLMEFGKLSKDGLLLKGKLEEYDEAFNAIDQAGDGVITRAQLGQLFAGLGEVLSVEELDRIVDEADVGHDGIDFADFLGLARVHLDLGEVLHYVATCPQPMHSLPVDLSSSEFNPGAMLGEVTTVHGERELDAIIRAGDDVIVELGFTWCRPCKAFWPKYQRFAKTYKKTRFVKIVGNENESCKHFAREVMHAKVSPMFAVYSKGVLVSTWTGANVDRFTNNLEELLPSAREFSRSKRDVVRPSVQLAHG